MASKGFWAGWVGFAALLLLVMGVLTFIEGLIALIEDEYYVVTERGVLVFDFTTWGWIMLIWGVVLVLAGLALWSRQSWARWFTIVVASLGLLAQLGFLGNAQYPLWTLTVIALDVLVLYALTVRWTEATEVAAPPAAVE
jgi:hypothetical protein